ncbi:MAG: PAS domain S-box protein, partial [Chloroflexi bacterium]|nr:PAS domain S-box protein [Chloroflexota bacterium]
VLRRTPGLAARLLAALADSQATYRETDCRWQLDGEPYDCDLQWVMAPSGAGRPALALVMAIDGCARWRTGQELRASQARWTEVQRLAHMGSFEYYGQEDRLVYSYETCRILERHPEERVLRPDDSLAYIHAEDRPRVLAAVQSAFEASRPFQIEFRLALPSGKVKYVLVTASSSIDPLNHERCFFGAILDLSEHKQVSRALEQSEAKYRGLVEQSIDAIVMTDATGCIAEWNRAAEDIFAIPQEAVLGEHLWDVYSRAAVQPEWQAQELARQRALFQDALQGRLGRDQQPYQTCIRRPDGEIRVIQSNVYTVETGSGRAVCSIIRDITEESMAQAALAESEGRYRLLSELTSDCAYCLAVDAGGQVSVEWITDTFSRIVGWTSAELVDMGGFPQLVHPDDAPLYRRHRQQWLNGQMSVVEFRILTQAGQVRWVSDLRKPVWSEKAGRVTRVYGAMTDITARKQAEETIRESENNFRVLFETMANGVIYRDTGGNVLSANPAALRILGRTLEDLQGKPYFDARHPILREDGSPIRCEEHPAILSLSSGQETRGMVMGVYNLLEARYRWVLIHAVPQYRPGETRPFQVYTTFEDITAIKEAHLALQASENRFRTLIEKAPLAIGINRRGTTLYANAQHLKLFGYDRLDEIKDTPVLDQVAPQDKAEVRRRIQQRNQGGPVYEQLETMGLRKDGTQFPFYAAVTEVNLPDGPATLAFFMDVTAWKHAEASLQETNRVLKAIISASPLAIISIDMQQRITLWTPAAEALYGWRAEEVIGQAITTIPGHLQDEFAQIVQGTARGQACANFETQRRRKDGRLVAVSISTSALYGPEGTVNGIMSIQVNIEQRKQAEAQLSKSLERLHALSARLQTVREEERARIAREIHDELGQNLTSLKLDLFRIKNQLEKAPPGAPWEPAGAKIGTMLALIDDTINDVRRIATELRPSVLDTLGLAAAVKWLAKDFRSRSGIECIFDPPQGSLDAHPEEATALFRICQEALTNVARHAQATSVVIFLRDNQDFFELVVLDNGQGIRPEEIDHTHSLGLLGMKERAYILGGSVVIEPILAGGTRVVARIPHRLPDKEP